MKTERQDKNRNLLDIICEKDLPIEKKLIIEKILNFENSNSEILLWEINAIITPLLIKNDIEYTKFIKNFIINQYNKKS